MLTQTTSDGDYAPIAYISSRLTTAEAKYATVEKECLAILWAIKYIRPYLEGQHFTVETDHRGLQWLRSIQNPAGRLMCWALRLQKFDFTIVYRPGNTNQAADALNRCYRVAAIDSASDDDHDTTHPSPWTSSGSIRTWAPPSRPSSRNYEMARTWMDILSRRMSSTSTSHPELTMMAPAASASLFLPPSWKE